MPKWASDAILRHRLHERVTPTLSFTWGTFGVRGGSKLIDLRRPRPRAIGRGRTLTTNKKRLDRTPCFWSETTNTMRRISRNLLSAISRKQSAKQLASRRNCAPPEDSSSSAQSYTQTDCALLTRLPFDVRLLIYDCIYSVEIHYSALGEDSYIIANASEYHTSSPASSPPIRPELKYRHLWTLLLTCKAM